MQTFSVLSAQDMAHLERQRACVVKLAQQIGRSPLLEGSQAELETLQAILDAHLLAPDQTWELQSVGIVLGDIFKAATDLHWVMVEDEYGRDPALRFHATSNLIFPLTMISKRVEKGEAVNVHEIYQGVMAHVESFTE